MKAIKKPYVSRKNTAERVFISLYIISTLYLGLETLITGKSFGEAIGMTIELEKIDIFFLLLLVFVSYGIMLLVYHYTKNKMITYAGFPKMRFNMERVHKFVTIVLIIKLIGTIYFNIGTVNGTVTASFSFLFSILKIEEFFPIYYVIARDKKKNYILNIVLFAVLQLLQGWTGFVLEIAFFELYFLLKKSVNIRNLVTIIRPITVAIAGIFSGGILYTVVWPFKQFIRYGGKVSYYSLTLNEGITKLVERLTNFPLVVTAWQNRNEIAELYQEQGIFFQELKGFLRPLLPSFLMSGKEMIRPLGNLIIKSIYPSVLNNTSSSYNMILYCITLFKSDILEFLLYIIVFVLLFVLVSSILHAFDNDDNDIAILYFLFLKAVLDSGNLEAVFSYGYVGALYMIFIMWIFKVIRIEKRDERD